MKVREIMTANPKACTPNNSLAEVAGLMWENDCGIIPVVTGEGAIVGLITDRDICMAAALKARNLDQIAVAEVISGEVVSCSPEDEIRTTLERMGDSKLRRLAVVNADGGLAGIISLNDIVRSAREPNDKKASVPQASVIAALQAISEHHDEGKAASAAARA